MKPPFKKQGTVFIEQHNEEFIIMFPDGKVEIALTKEDAEKKAKKWLSKDLGKKGIGIGHIEWR